MKPLLAVSVGCPSGIGPEVSVRAALLARNVRVLLVGAEPILERAIHGARLARTRFVSVRSLKAPWVAGSIGLWESSAPIRVQDAPFGRPTKLAGKVQLEWFERATELVACGEADALVTGPVSKAAVQASGAPRARGFLGHTEHLGRRFGVREPTMAFWSKRFTTALVTTHLPLAHVAEAMTVSRVEVALDRLTRFVAERSGRTPRILVCGLNPHAGEEGRLGHEEEQIRTAIRRLKIRATIRGPFAAEAAFRLAKDGGADGVLAMYHDQATVPMKLLAFGDAVNVTLGLPIVRTSVDHGTAYDIAGRGTADASGMRLAMKLAGELARQRARANV